jgi:hypothetical protein
MWVDIEILADRWEDEQNFFYQQNLYNMKKNTKVTKTMKAKKVTTKKVVAKKTKAVAKKKTARVTLKDKYTNQYKIVKQYSENLMQDVFNVVYRTKTLKRFINERLASNYINQEVLIKLANHSIDTAKKSRTLAKELQTEFA